MGFQCGRLTQCNVCHRNVTQTRNDPFYLSFFHNPWLTKNMLVYFLTNFTLASSKPTFSHCRNFLYLLVLTGLLSVLLVDPLFLAFHPTCYFQHQELGQILIAYSTLWCCLLNFVTVLIAYHCFHDFFQMNTAIAIEDVRREVKILRALTGHNNLVQFYDAYEDRDNVYIVME